MKKKVIFRWTYKNFQYWSPQMIQDYIFISKEEFKNKFPNEEPIKVSITIKEVEGS